MENKEYSYLQSKNLQEALVLQISQSFEDKLRQRIYLDCSIDLAKILTDDKRGIGS